MWHDYSETNVETVGLGIDPERLRARVLRGVGEEWEETDEAKVDENNFHNVLTGNGGGL